MLDFQITDVFSILQTMKPHILTGLEDMYKSDRDVLAITNKYLTVILPPPLLKSISDTVIIAKKLTPNWPLAQETNLLIHSL